MTLYYDVFVECVDGRPAREHRRVHGLQWHDDRRVLSFWQGGVEVWLFGPFGRVEVRPYKEVV